MCGINVGVGGGVTDFQHCNMSVMCFGMKRKYLIVHEQAQACKFLTLKVYINYGVSTDSE